MLLDGEKLSSAQEAEQAKKSKKKDRKKRRDASAKDGSSGADAEPAGSADLDAHLPAVANRDGDSALDDAAQVAVAIPTVDDEEVRQPAEPAPPDESPERADDGTATADRSSEDELVEAMAAARLSRSGPAAKPAPARPARAQAGVADPSTVIATRKEQQQQQQQGQRAPPQGKQQRAANGTGATNGKRSSAANGRAASLPGGGTPGGSGTVTPRGDPPSQPSSKASTPRVKGGAADRLRGGPVEGGSRLGTPSKPSGGATPSKAGNNTPSKPAANGRYLMVGPLAANDSHGPGSRHGSRHASMEGVSPVASPTNGRRQPHGVAAKGQQQAAQMARPQQASPSTGRQAVTSSGATANGDVMGYQAASPAPKRTPVAATLPRAAPSAPHASPGRPQAAPLAAGASPRLASQAGALPGRPSALPAPPGWHPMGSSHPAEPAFLARQYSGASVPSAEQRLGTLPIMHRLAPDGAAASAAIGAVQVLPSLFSSQQVDWSFSAPNRSDGNVAAHMPMRWGASNGGVAGSADSAPGLPAGFAPLSGGPRPLFPGPPVRPQVGFAPDHGRVAVPPAGFGPVSQPPHLSASVPVLRTSAAFDVSGRMQHSLDSLQSSFGSPASADLSTAIARQPLDGGALQQQLRQLWADDRPPAGSMPAEPLRDAFKGSLWGSANVWG